MRYLLSLLLLLAPSITLTAQETFTQHLTRTIAGEGRVVLYQDAEIEALVNGTKVQGVQGVQGETDDVLPATPAATNKLRMNGFRIQVYAGGNNRQSKNEAYRIASQVRSAYPGHNVYTHFISPRWICRVGDFKTREEANELLRQMREAGTFAEASIVKSKIVVTY